MDLRILIEIEALKIECEGMKTENQNRIAMGEALAYREGSFFDIAYKMRALAVPDEKREVLDEQILRCSFCSQPSGIQGQRSGDICGRMEGLPSEDKHCPGILRKG